MWVLLAVAFLALIAGIGGALAGGIFTIVLIPLAVIALISAIVYGYFSGGAERAARRRSGRDRPAAPATAQTNPTPDAPSTPEDLVDARRANQ